MTLFTEHYPYTLLRDVQNGQELECVSAVSGAEKVNSGGLHHSHENNFIRGMFFHSLFATKSINLFPSAHFLHRTMIIYVIKNKILKQTKNPKTVLDFKELKIYIFKFHKGHNTV